MFTLGVNIRKQDVHYFVVFVNVLFYNLNKTFTKVNIYVHEERLIILPNKDDINISKNDLIQILELTGLPLSSVEKLIDLKDAEQKEIEQRKKELDNPPFVQVYKGMGLKALQLLIKDNQLASEIFVFFLDNMNNNNLVMASQQLLSEEFGKGRTTIYKAIKYLEEHNFINVAKVGTANAYIINPEVAFQNAHNKKKYVGFNGTILLSKKENNTLFDKYNYNNIKVLKEKE